MTRPPRPERLTVDPRTTWPALIGALVRRESLTADETAWAMNEIMNGEATAVQIAAFGIAMRSKGETVGELAGLAQTMLDHAVPCTVPGRLVDLVGTGGDGAHTVNISTMGAVVAAAAGARVAKHGNRAASSNCGAADVLEALGVVIDLPPQLNERLAGEIGIAFLFASFYHPALRHTATARSELRVPTVFNFLGPVTNPARPHAVATGIADERMCEIIAGVLASRGCSSLVFHGGDGLDELTTTTVSNVWVVSEGTISQAVLDPAELGIPRARREDLRGGDAAHNASVARAVLAGERGAVRDIVLLNAAAALAADAGVAGAGELPGAIREAYQRAQAAVDSGAAAALLDRWARASQRLAADKDAGKDAGKDDA